MEFIGWNLSVPRGASGLNFKIYGVCFDALRGGQRKFYRGSVVVAQQWRHRARALRAALAAKERERCGRLCGAWCGGSSEDRAQ